MWFGDVTDDMGLHSVSDFYAILQYSFTHVTMVAMSVLQNKVKCHNFEQLAACDITESSSNSALSEQFSNTNRL